MLLSEAYCHQYWWVGADRITLTVALYISRNVSVVIKLLNKNAFHPISSHRLCVDQTDPGDCSVIVRTNELFQRLRTLLNRRTFDTSAYKQNIRNMMGQCYQLRAESECLNTLFNNDYFWLG